jgi:hypothetical protein
MYRLVESFQVVAEAVRACREEQQLSYRLSRAFQSAASKFRPLADQLQVTCVHCRTDYDLGMYTL